MSHGEALISSTATRNSESCTLPGVTWMSVRKATRSVSQGAGAGNADDAHSAPKHSRILEYFIGLAQFCRYKIRNSAEKAIFALQKTGEGIPDFRRHPDRRSPRPGRMGRIFSRRGTGDRRTDDKLHTYFYYENHSSSGFRRAGQGVRDCGTAAGTDRRGVRQVCGRSRDAGGRRRGGLRHARRRRAGRCGRKTPPRHHRSRDRGHPHRTALRVRAGGRPGRTERPGREFHDEPQGHPRPRGEGTGAEDGAVFLRRIARRTARGRRESR